MRRYRPNPRLEAELERTAEMRRALADVGEAAAARANGFARAIKAGWMPRGGGRSADPIVISEDGDEVRLVNTDHAGHLMEWGSAKNPPHAPLRRGVRAAGLRLDEK